IFIKQCSTLLDIQERVLLTELNKIRINRAKSAERKSTSKVSGSFPATADGAADMPPADFFLTEEEKGAIGESSPSNATSNTITSELLQEREIVRIFLNYGAEPVTWEGEGDIPVAAYLLASMDDIDFEDQACSKIIDEFKRQAENYQIPEAKFFISSADKDVASLAIDCIASKYEISPNWNDDKRKIYVTQEIEHLQNLVVQAIYRIKKRK